MALSFDGTTGISASGNITGGNVIASGALVAGTFAPSSVSTAGNVTGGNVSATANVIGGNIQTGGLISATGNITSTAFSTGDFSITQSGTKLYIQYNGANILSIDSGGNIRAIQNVTAYGSP